MEASALRSAISLEVKQPILMQATFSDRKNIYSDHSIASLVPSSTYAPTCISFYFSGSHATFTSLLRPRKHLYFMHMNDERSFDFTPRITALFSISIRQKLTSSFTLLRPTTVCRHTIAITRLIMRTSRQLSPTLLLHLFIRVDNIDSHRIGRWFQLLIYALHSQPVR
jgi:hypothetical protein